jgi:serine/threonine protein kinase
MRILRDSGRSPLKWNTRSRIALAVAHGLNYIHTISPQCAHGNIKASNILLSGNNGFPEGAKIANHGLAHLIGGHAAYGYNAPELTKFGDANQKSDVYSFGMHLNVQEFTHSFVYQH